MKLPLPTLLAALLLTPLAACGSTDPGTDGDRLSVVASFYPLAYVAERVAGDRADVTNLTTPGQEPHDLELSLERIAQVSDADLVVYEKDLQPAVDDAVASSGPDRQVEAGQVAGLEDGDPHFWLDPERLGAVASAVAAELTDLDPDHADEYSAHLDDLLTDLRALDREFRTGLADCAIDTVVVSHDAFSYLGKYGLSFAAINGLSPDAEPSPRTSSHSSGSSTPKGSPRCSPRAWPVPSSPAPWPASWASGPPSSTRSRACPTPRRTRTTSAS